MCNQFGPAAVGYDLGKPTTHRKHTMDSDRTALFAYTAESLRASLHDPTSDGLDTAGNLVLDLSRHDDDDSALSWHLAADAARMKALARQDQVAERHLVSVIGAALRRIERELAWVTS